MPCLSSSAYFGVTPVYLFTLLVCSLTDLFYIFYTVHFSRSPFPLPSSGILKGKLMLPLRLPGLSSLLTKAQEMEDNAHITQEFVSSVIAGEAFADASLLAFRDSSSFRAGELHRHMV